MAIDPKTLAGISLKDALDLATQIEEDARERYEELAAQMEQHSTPEAAEFFAFMARNEAKHRDKLAERRRSLFGDEPITVESTVLDEIEAPSYETVRAFMSVAQALGVALSSEVKAHAFFACALEHVHDTDVRTLFEELRDEEVEHQELVRIEIAKLPPESAADAAGFVDDPIAQ